jgi:L-alanine-DL-glutamate epimerase-like enolase superfamily enzyme
VRIVEVRQQVVPIASEIANAFIDFSTMDVSVVAVVSDQQRDGRPVVGYGFNSNGRYAQPGLLGERFVPRLLAAAPEELVDDAGALDPLHAWDVLMRNEKPGGHGERSVAVGVLDMALWDLTAKLAQRPLHRLLADRFGDGTCDERVAVYAAGGYYAPGKGLGELRDEIRRFLDAGYREVKIKIGGAPLSEDLERVEAVLDLVGGDGTRLAVDANGRFDADRAIAYAEALAPYGLRWYEEPGDPLDFELNAEVARRYRPPLATGENLFSHQDARNLLRYGGLRPDRDVLQMDPALGYGLTEFLRTLAVVRDHGWSPRRLIPHGGHQLGLAIAAGLRLGGNESYPGVFAPFGGFADGTPIEDGSVALPDLTGVGFEAKADLLAVLERT